MNRRIQVSLGAVIFVALTITMFQNCGRFTSLGSATTLGSSSTSGGSRYVNLSWSAPASGATATGYEIEQSTDNQNFSVVMQVSAGTTAKVSGLPAGTYYFRVRAYNAAGASLATTSVTATVN